jgi:hypothetical protein
MSVVHGSQAAQLLRWAVDDPETVGRYRAKVVAVPGSACAWWSGALPLIDTVARSGYRI